MSATHDARRCVLALLFAALSINRLRSYSHSGKWEFREPEACIMWSDTASCNRESVGDLIRVHNPNGFNFSAPCLTSVVGWESR